MGGCGAFVVPKHFVLTALPHLFILSVKPPFPLLFYNAYGTKHTHFIKQTATCQLNLLFIGLFVHSVFYLPVHNFFEAVILFYFVYSAVFEIAVNICVGSVDAMVV